MLQPSLSMAPNLASFLATMKAALRYDDDLNWFDPAELRLVEEIPRGNKPTVFAFVYEPTGRHLFLDDRGRTYQFKRPTDPTKSTGSFSLHYQVAKGIESLRPELVERRAPTPWSEDDDVFGSDDWCSTGCYDDGMRREITQRELRNQSGEIMRALDRGDEFVVTRNGVPVGELLPLRRREFVPSEVLLEAMRGAPHVDFRQLRADLEAVASYDPTPRV